MNPSPSVVARYAAAALAVAGSAPQGNNQFQESVGALVQAVKQPMVAAVLTNPRLTPAQRQQIATSLAKATDAPKALRNLLGVLAQNRRLALLPAVLTALQSQLATAAGITTVTVHTAAPLTEMQKIQLKALIKNYQHSRDVALTEIAAPQLVGGFRAFFAGMVWDMSVAGRLAKLKTSLQQTLNS